MAQFSRSNVSDAAFSKSQVDRSSYNLNMRTTITPKLGAFHPVRCTRLMPNSTVQGSVNPRLQLEKVISPQIGRTRMDTHTFAVPFRRICNDFKIGVEKQNFSDGELLTFGQFDMYDLFYSLFTSLFFYRHVDGGVVTSLLDLRFPKFVYDSVRANVIKAGLFPLPIMDSTLDQPDLVYDEFFRLSSDEDNCSLSDIMSAAVSHIASVYAMYAFDDGELGLYNYPKDFYAQEYIRLSDFHENYPWNDPDPYYVISFIMEPYVGINSNADMLGYPIIRLYDSLHSLFGSSNNFVNSAVSVSWYSPLHPALVLKNTDTLPDFAFVVSAFLLPYSGIVGFAKFEDQDEYLSQSAFNPFKVYSGFFMDFISSGESSVSLFQQSLPYRLYSDFPLRAAYSCWFDRMRDWHIENRSKCLDPDTFTRQTLFNRLQSPYHHGSSVYDFTFSLSRSVAYALLVPRQRYYADDALTTIKTDDKFRHIYSPVLQLEDVAGAVDTRSDDVLNNIERIYLDSLAIAFPSGSLFGNIKSDANLASLRNDLCLAKRAGMLERWLARNYFTPDNYNGFISAHFDTDVSDMDMLISRYLGGSEQMVSGEQQVADITTEQTERGTRTFSGGVQSDSSFSIQVHDYTYIVSFVSLVPLVEYDSLSQAVLETNFNELPSPEYANDTRIEARLSDFIRDFSLNHDIIGYVPRYYLDRTCLDSVHGRYLTDYRSYSWFRDWFNMTFVSGSNFGDHGFALTPYSLRVNLPLDSFLGLAPWDSIAFGEIDLPFATNVPLSAAIEII